MMQSTQTIHTVYSFVLMSNVYDEIDIKKSSSILIPRETADSRKI